MSGKWIWEFRASFFRPWPRCYTQSRYLRKDFYKESHHAWIDCPKSVYMVRCDWKQAVAKRKGVEMELRVSRQVIADLNPWCHTLSRYLRKHFSRERVTLPLNVSSQNFVSAQMICILSCGQGDKSRARVWKSHRTKSWPEGSITHIAECLGEHATNYRLTQPKNSPTTP
jgi:hypothetical protein